MSQAREHVRRRLPKSPAPKRVLLEMSQRRQVPEPSVHQAPVPASSEVHYHLGREWTQGEETHLEGYFYHRVRRRNHFARGVEDPSREFGKDRRH